MQGPWGLPRRLLCLSWEIRPQFPSSPLRIPAPEEALLRGLWPLLSHQRGPGGLWEAQGHPSWKRVAAWACQEPQLPQTLKGRPLATHYFLLLRSAPKQLQRSITRGSCLSFLPETAPEAQAPPTAASFCRGPGTSFHSLGQHTPPGLLGCFSSLGGSGPGLGRGLETGS